MSEDTQGYPYTQRNYTTGDGTEIVIREWEGQYGRPDGYGHNLRTERTETDPYGNERVFYEDIYGNEVRWIVTGSDGAVRDVYKDADGRWWQELGNTDGTYKLETIDGIGPGEVPKDTSEYLGEWRNPEEGEEPKGLITQGQSPGEDPWGDLQGAPPEDFKDNVFADPPPPAVEAPPEDFKDNVFADPPPPDDDIQVRLPDAFKDNAVEPPAPWSYGDIQVRPPDAFKDNAVEPPPYQEPPPEEPPVAEPPPPPVTQTPEAEPPVQPTPRGDDGGGIPGLGVPYQDFIPSIPMVQDPTTGEWRNAEPGEIPGAEGGEADPNAPLQFGNTGNLQLSQEFEEALLFEEDLFNPEAPGPTLSTDLFDPTAPGPTLDTGLIPELAHSSQVVEALNQYPDLAATLARDPGMIEHLKQDASLFYGERTGISQGDGGRTDQGLTDPSLTEQEDTPDQDVDYTL